MSPIGSIHPVLFFAGVYLVALVFSIFICSSLFYSCNASSSVIGEEKATPVIPSEAPQTAMISHASLGAASR
jgi:hypothetical protein